MQRRNLGGTGNSASEFARGAEYDYGAVLHALDIGPDSSVAERTIDITTLGARSGIPRRVEVWFHRVDGRWYLTGMPVPRSWYANLRAHPRFVVHLKHGVTAELPATAAPVDEPTRRRVITAVLDLQNRPDIAARVSRRQELDDWLARSPLVEIVFVDDRFRTSSSVQSGWCEPQGSVASCPSSDGPCGERR
jgi:deazaflavin-dependent oxidoreductase (nitroreductase family)